MHIKKQNWQLSNVDFKEDLKKKKLGKLWFG